MLKRGPLPDCDQCGFREEMAFQQTRRSLVVLKGDVAEGALREPSAQSRGAHSILWGCIFLSNQQAHRRHLAFALAILSLEMPLSSLPKHGGECRFKSIKLSLHAQAAFHLILTITLKGMRSMTSIFTAEESED